jgi:hypothetical protein
VFRWSMLKTYPQKPGPVPSLPRRGQNITIRGLPGLAFSTGAGYALSWEEGGWPYQISSGLGLDDALQLANGLEALSLADWKEHIGALLTR